jgi:hypothetical protein
MKRGMTLTPPNHEAIAAQALAAIDDARQIAPFLFIRWTSGTLHHLAEFQFDRRGAAKNRHRDLEPRARLIDLLDNAVEGREGTIRDTDLVTYLEGN